MKNHPFVDGNKRVGLACSIAFLRLNGIRVRATDDDLVDIVMGVAEGRRSKADVAVFSRERRASRGLGAMSTQSRSVRFCPK